MLRISQTPRSGYSKFQGWVLQYDEVPRSSSRSDISGSPFKKRKANAVEGAGLSMELLLSDSHGPAMVTLWGDCVKQFLELVSAFFSPSTTSKPIVSSSMLRMIALPQNDWRGSLLSPTNVFHSVGKRVQHPPTSISFTHEESSPHKNVPTEFQVHSSNV